MRIIHTEEIISNIRQMCIEANHMLTPDMQKALECAVADEKSPIGQKVLGQLQDNLQIAQEDTIPICQDTGMAVVFLEIGQDVHFEGGSLTVQFRRMLQLTNYKPKTNHRTEKFPPVR